MFVSIAPNGHNTSCAFIRRVTQLILGMLLCMLASCGGGSSSGSSPSPTPPTPPSPESFYTDRTTSLPQGLAGRCMAGVSSDVDNDGDTDIILAIEFDNNLILLNDGSASFSISSTVPDTQHDSEDVVVEDFDGDSDVDILFVNEDSFDNELWLNDGSGNYTLFTDMLPTAGISNSVNVVDLNDDSTLDVIIGNDGENILWLNQPNTGFELISTNLSRGTTQDIDIVDFNADGKPDVVIANETTNKILINVSTGSDILFADETDFRLEPLIKETRSIIHADFDNDGDIDLLASNVDFFSGFENTSDLLINDGSGVFVRHDDFSLIGNYVDAKATDVNGDGLQDIITATAHLTNDMIGASSILINQGGLTFKRHPLASKGNTFEIVLGDFNNDQKEDIYLCNRASSGSNNNGGQDQLMMRK